MEREVVRINWRAKLRPRVVLGALVLLQLGAAAPARAGWQPATQISVAGEDAFFAEIAFDQKRNALAVWRRNGVGGYFIAAAFRPADGSFGPAATISGPAPGLLFLTLSPQVAFDKKRNALAVWERWDGTDSLIEAAFRPVNGSFGAAIQLSPAGQDGYRPRLAFDRKANALVVWGASDGTNSFIEAAERPMGGSFGPATPISAAGAFLSQVAIDKKRNALALWVRSDGANDRIEAAVRPADGTFAPATPISAAGEDASLAIEGKAVAFDKKNNALVVWRRSDGADFRIEAADRPAGGTFAPGVLISAPGEDADEATVAFDKKRNALALWGRSDGTNFRIEAAFRPVGGAFAPATPISAAGQDAHLASVAFDKKGNALAVWHRSDGTNSRIEAAVFTP
jgi:hypothetical protein